MKHSLALLLAITASAAAQEPPAQPPAPKPAAERPSLNLRLDNPSSFATIAPGEKQAPLPTLGGDARTIAPPQREGSLPTPNGAFPKDTSPTH